MPVDAPKQEEDPRFSLKDSFQTAKAYVDTQLELLKLSVIERTSRIMARLLLDVFRAILALLVLFFLSMALGFYLSYLLGNNALGFLATAGIFVVVIVLLSAFNTSIKRKIIDLSIKKIFDDIEEEEEEARNDLNNAQQETAAAAAPDETQTT